jgi:hypothetical protein
MPPGSGRGDARPSGTRKSGPEPRDATVERRKARVPVTRHAGAFTRCPGYLRLSALCPLKGAMTIPSAARDQKQVELQPRASRRGARARALKTRWRDAVFKRDARPNATMPLDVRGLSDTELDELLEDLERRHVAQKTNLYHRCVDRRCRRLRTCAADCGRCVCMNAPAMGKRERKRVRAVQARSAAA